MFEGEDIAFNGLEICSYRHLQGMAKEMGLPSNVKKVHLIEMIRAKKYCTDTELKAIVNRVKMERKVNAQAKKKKPKRKTFRLQGAEVSSTSNSQSPPITHTPKRSSDFVIKYSPDISRTIMKYQPRPNILRTGTSILQPLKRHIESDRVLRSYNAVKRPNYRIMEQNDCVIDVVNTQNSMQERHQERVQEIRQECAYQSMNLMVQKHRPIMNATVVLNRDRQLVPISRSSNITKPVKRQRKLSGIYPLEPLKKPIYDYVPAVGFRQPDGRLTKINAFVQRPLSNTLPKKTIVPKQQPMVTVQDVINYNVDRSTGDYGNSMEGSKHNEIDYSNENGLADERDYEIDSQGVTHEIPKAQTMVLKPSPKTINLESSRKVYKPSQNKPNATNKGWNYSIEYLEHNTGTRKEWNVYDNDESLDKDNAAQTEQNANVQSFNHKAKATEPISTNYKVKQGRITEHISRDYQVEYQKFNRDSRSRNLGPKNKLIQKITNSNVNHASPGTSQVNHEIIVNYAKSCTSKDQKIDRNVNHTRTSPTSKVNHEITVRYARSGTKSQYNEKIANRNGNHAIFCTKDQFNQQTDRNISHAKSGTPNHFGHERTDRRVIYNQYGNARSGIDQRFCQEVDGNICHQQFDQRPNVDNSKANTTEMLDNDLDTSSKYPNMAALTDVFPSEDYTQEPMDRDNSNYAVYYHKKIRAEHVKTQKEYFDRLPKINDVFSKFNDVQYKCVSQPLYVQVSGESERVPPLPRVLPINIINSTCMLETIYNFKNQFMVNPPMLHISTTQTYCTYSTKTVSTAMAQPVAAVYNNINAYERASLYQQNMEQTPRLYDYSKPQFMPRPDFGCDEVLSSSTASLDTTNTQELGANVTIPEMVEDALELISQDGDYMERIGMDVRVQCILCDWAGPKIILEYHIKKDHSEQVQQECNKEWSCVFTLGELVSQPSWRSRLVQSSDSVLVLCAKYTDTDDILVSLSMIPTEPEITKHARITVYNKLSGKPYSYEGEVKDLPDSMPYEYGLECLELDIGKLDLVPNSANLKLVNRELVGPSGVVVGQLELNKVEIPVHVKLID